MSQTTFKHPEPKHVKKRIWPVFMPFLGCPSRCVYCSQERQTGTGLRSLNDIYQDIEREIPEFFKTGERDPMELAFFGGTFTALPFEWQMRFIGLAERFKREGFITAVRFSTRPDCIDANRLEKLKEAGLDIVELGIQSFSALTLRRSARNYTPETAIAACRTVKTAGLSLVIQLLPGLPGSQEGEFQRDVAQTVKLGPDAVRLYPCLTVAGTVLERLYRAGKYRPWTLEQTEIELAHGLMQLWPAGIHVIRIGVAHEEGLAESIVAGPFHPALGQAARSRALYLFLGSKLAQYKSGPARLSVPARYSGEFWGHKGNLRELYAGLGLSPENVVFKNTDEFILEF
ncbi:radical SAM protein [Maridesulfovibrio sp.]|uniref:elongator complex protein 3 n=1 Tax=Maridesulfovibrio sp. TaxID=2795000 RepID=UPI002A18AE3E|nr:radical SAM protein [Maridesulfovibrio sp.]